MRTNNCSLKLFTKQEKANDVNAFSTVAVLESEVLKINCVCACGKSHNFVCVKTPVVELNPV